MTILSLLLILASQVPTVETSIPSDRTHTPDRAFDDDPTTYFESRRTADDSDDFTLTFARPVEVSRVEILTGKPDGDEPVEGGTLELSVDARHFAKAAEFRDGRAIVDLKGKAIRCVRVRPAGLKPARVAIREVIVDATVPIPPPRVVARIVFDTTEAPELAGWGLDALDLADRFYPAIADALRSEGSSPPHVVEIVFKANMKGIAATTGSEIRIAAGWVKAHPDDFGMLVHELAHVVQSYPPNRAGWLVEGIADYIRLRLYEPGLPAPRIDPDRASYRDAYKTAATFLAWVEAHHDPRIIPKLNAALRASRYDDALFKDATGQDLDSLWRSFADSLRSEPPHRD